jgi:hypothetical protein
MAERVAELMSKASGNMERQLPRKGERLRCSRCGMEIQLTADCKCQSGDHPHFECCGQELNKA